MPGKNRNLNLIISILSIGVCLLASCGTNISLTTPSIPTRTIINPPTPTFPPGTSQENPARVGISLSADNIKFKITGSIRPADGIVSSGDMFNVQPGQWQQYVFVTLAVSCELSGNQQCTLSLFQMRLLGSDNMVRVPQRAVAGVTSIFQNLTSIQGGTTAAGNVPFIISIGDSSLVLAYDPLVGESIFLALP